MNETMMNWQDLQFFLSVARTGGLAGASQLTGKSAPTLSRRMLALESNTGQELFERHSHGYTLTSDGENLLELAMKLEALISPISQGLEKRAGRLIKVSAGSWMTRALCQQVHQILKPAETARLRFISAEHRLDITHRETIIGIRNERPQSQTLATRKIGQVKFAGYAVDAKIRQWLPVKGTTPSARWLNEQSVDKAQVEVTSPTNALDLALAGAGRVLLPMFVGKTHPQMQQVTPAIAELSHDQWLVVHQDDRHHPDVRSVINNIYTVAKQLTSPQAH